MPTPASTASRTSAGVRDLAAATSLTPGGSSRSRAATLSRIMGDGHHDSKPGRNSSPIRESDQKAKAPDRQKEKLWRLDPRRLAKARGVREEGHPEASGHGSSKRRASRGLSEFPRWGNSRALERIPR